MKKTILALSTAIFATAAVAEAPTDTWQGYVVIENAVGYQGEPLVPTGYDNEILFFENEEMCLTGLLAPALEQNMNVVVVHGDGFREVVFKTGIKMIIRCVEATQT